MSDLWAWDDTRRVWSLWEIMNLFDVPQILYEMSILGGIEAAYAAAKRQGLGGESQSVLNLREALKLVARLGVLFQYEGLTECARLSASCVSQMTKPLVDTSTAAACLYHFREEVLNELKARKFLQIAMDRSVYLGQEHLFGEAVWNAFPSSREDVKEAGNCLAVECCTACVFHLMRCAEHGVRALANDRDITVPKGPIELATWEQIIIEMEKAEGAIQQYPKTLAREEQLKFYHGAMMELRAFKNKFRNGVMHTRDQYDRDEAMSAFNHVRQFMQILAGKVSEQTRTPLIWGEAQLL